MALLSVTLKVPSANCSLFLNPVSRKTNRVLADYEVLAAEHMYRKCGEIMGLWLLCYGSGQRCC